MKPGLTNDLIHNPFRNRFNDPVTWRLDEMQAHSNIMRESDLPASRSGANAKDFVRRNEPNHEGGMFTGVFALALVLLATVFVLFRG